MQLRTGEFNIQPSIRFTSFMDMVWYGVIEAEWDMELIEKVIMVAWSLWKNRNELRNRGVKKSATRIGYDALKYLAEYQECVAEPVQQRDVQPEFWKPPLREKFKINIDEAVFAD